MTSPSVGLQFARTPVGETEMAQPSRNLSLPARALLEEMGSSLAIEQRFAEAFDARLGDAITLLSLGLIKARVNTDDPRHDAELHVLIARLFALAPYDLYTLLTRQAKLRLGLIQGFGLILALERCNTVRERTALAIRFVDAVWRREGADGISRLLGVVRDQFATPPC